MHILSELYKKLNAPVVTLIASRGSSPFQILISTIISLRTKDQVTAIVSKNLFEEASTPEEMVNLAEEKLETLIRPAGFYKRKSQQIKAISQRLIDEFNSKVPNDLDTLLSFKGIGRKTANLVLIEAFNIPAMCVDTHVHRISNRWGYVSTKKADDTEFALRKKLPKDLWMEYNKLLVAFGQTVCQPISPKCSECPISNLCDKLDVKKSR